MTTPAIRAPRLLVLASALALAPAALGDAPARRLFTPVDPVAARAPSAVAPLLADAQVERIGFAQLDRAALPRPGAAGELLGAGVFELDLFADRRATVDLSRLHPGAEGKVEADRYVVSGPVTGLVDDQGRAVNGAFAVVSVDGPAVVTTVFAPGLGMFETTTIDGQDAPDGATIVRQLDRSKLQPCGVDASDTVGDPGLRHLNQELPTVRNVSDPLPGPLIDVLVVYTPLARDAAGGVNGMAAAMAGWFASTNIFYENSLMGQRVRLVHLALTNYTETTSGTDLSRLQGTADGFMDEVHALRNQFGADVVHLVCNVTDVCGRASLMINVNPGFASSAFGLTRYACGAMTFAHELGHNFGCAHDHDNGNIGAFCYSFGERTALPQQQITIMSYEPGQNIPFFSNPNITFNGQVIGRSGTPCMADSADNSRSQNNTAPTAAAWRATVVPDPAPGAFSVVAPAHNGIALSRNPALSWQTSSDALNYTMELATDAGFSNIIYALKRYTNTAAGLPQNLLDFGQTYHWRIVANGLVQRTNSSPAVATFRVRSLFDLNGDGVVGSADLGILLGSWGPCPAPPNTCSADVNGDGVVNSADLAALLGAWGS